MAPPPTSVLFESAARVRGNKKGDDDELNNSPPLASGRFVDCAAVRELTGAAYADMAAAVADAIEQAWRHVRGNDAVVMVPMLLSPLHKLRMYFSPDDQDDESDSTELIACTKKLSDRLVAEQVAETAAAAVGQQQTTTTDDEQVVAAKEDWPYNPKLPTLMLVSSHCAARVESSGQIVCNPGTPVRDWFRVLNHELSRTNAPTRLLPMLTVEGTSKTNPVYCAVRVPADEPYHEKHQELRAWGVKNSKDPGLQWQVVCDYTKIVLAEMQSAEQSFEVHKLIMSPDRSLQGVLVQNYTQKDLSAMKEKFGMRWLDEAD